MDYNQGSAGPRGGDPPSGRSVVAGGRVTSMDVARRAGVSRSTVSYVLNGVTNQKIPASTRARGLQAAADLGYAPSLAAQALRRGTSRSILLVLPDAPI